MNSRLMKRSNSGSLMSSKTQIPKGWRQVRLGDVADVAFSSVDKKTVESELPVKLCNYTDVFYNRRIQDGMGFMFATATPAECNRWALRQGDVLFTKDSETPDEIGIPSYVADDMPNVLCGYHLGLARPCPALVSGAFLARTLASRTSGQEFGRIANGITRFGLTLDATRNLPILLPPLPEQRAIAAVLDSIDDAIERTEAVIAATEQLRDSLLHELLTRGVPGWHTGWKEAPGLGTIPEAWEVVRLGDVAEVERGKFAHRPRNEPRFYGGNVPFVQTGDVVRANGKITQHSQTLNELGLSISRLFPTGTIIITIAANIGETAITTYPVAFPDSLVGVTPIGIETKFLEYFLRTQKVRLNQLAPESAQKNINLEDLRPLATPLPSLPEQRAIAAVLDGVGAAIERNRTETNMLKLSKESTADALLTGRVRVNVDPAKHDLHRKVEVK